MIAVRVHLSKQGSQRGHTVSLTADQALDLKGKVGTILSAGHWLWPMIGKPVAVPYRFGWTLVYAAVVTP